MWDALFDALPVKQTRNQGHSFLARVRVGVVFDANTGLQGGESNDWLFSAQ